MRANENEGAAVGVVEVSSRLTRRYCVCELAAGSVQLLRAIEQGAV